MNDFNDLVFNVDTIDVHMARLEDIASSVEKMRSSGGVPNLKELLSLQKEASVLSKGIQEFVEETASEIKQN